MLKERLRSAQMAPPDDLALAWVQLNRDWNWESAELSLNKAAELEPGDAAILRYRSFLDQSLSRWLNEAIKLLEQSIARDPLLASAQSDLGYLLYFVLIQGPLLTV